MCFSVVLGSGTALGADFADVLATPDKYDGHNVELIGIARVPGYFYLFADLEAAAKTDLSKALLVRKNNFTQPEYRELDRQWVRVTGIMSSQPRPGWDPGTGLLLDHVELVRDRPSPRIADRTVLGIFKNSTAKPLAIEVIPRSEPGGVIFFLKPGDVNETDIWEGRVIASQLTGPSNVPLDKREIGKPIASGEITFSGLPTDYEYSSESSDERRLYFRILDNRIESVPASDAKDWKTSESKDGLK
jgi:hypothetical protein